MALSCDLGRIANLLPMHLFVSPSLDVVSSGKAIGKLVRIGAHISDSFSLDESRHQGLGWLELSNGWPDGAPLFAHSRLFPSVSVRGSAAHLSSGYLMNFGFGNCLPAAVDALQLSAKDFAAWDMSVEYFLLLEANNVAMQNLSQLQKGLSDANELARIDSITDPLTRVLNRRGFSEALIRLRATFGEFRCRLFLIDVNSFKEINDQRGHAEGDRVLKKLSRFLAGLKLGGYSIVSRFGGDEFVVFCVCRENSISSDGMHDEIERRISELSCLDGAVPFSVCAGSSPECLVREFDVEFSLMMADVMLYDRKFSAGDRSTL